MPIYIYILDSSEEVDFLCDDNWELPEQLYHLEEWLKTKAPLLPPNSYVADISFSIRRDASGGGGVLTSEMIGILNKIGMELYFSEYIDVDTVKYLSEEISKYEESKKESE